MELKKQEDGTYGVNKYYTRGTELIKEDIYEEMDVATVADATVGTNPESTSYKTIHHGWSWFRYCLGRNQGNRNYNNRRLTLMMLTEFFLRKPEPQKMITFIPENSITNLPAYTI